MAWKLTPEDLEKMPGQQQRIRLYALARHLLTLPEPPPTWAECEQWLTTQCQQARQYGLTSPGAIRLFVEALHYVPDALDHNTVKGYLTSGALEQFRAERVLEWAREQKESMDELQ